eukprot:TRINITY_DN59051_c3_g1_i1.p1 TRINITY_DN59051_c3_g1~~TRINITY_DN59051_c3_g1_i1.p1  ORF type:complete len:947 (-),score=-30.00 TRINITY_DN59051_c3_g1_i1:112-2952(-)
MPSGDSEKKAISLLSNDSNESKDEKVNENINNENSEELSEEDKALKDGLELAVARLQESNWELHTLALQYLTKEIRTSTSSMTSVPKPLKFLRPSYKLLGDVYVSWPLNHPERKNFADVLSVLAMTMSEQGTRECLSYRLKGNLIDISSWGHEYVRSLSGEISEEYNKRHEDVDIEEDVEVDDLIVLVDDIIPFQMTHNAEADAIDLLMEVQSLHKLIETKVVDDKNYERVCLYLLRCGEFMSDPDDYEKLFVTAYTIYKKHYKFIDALRVALKLDDETRLMELFEPDSGTNAIERKQMAFILGRHRSNFVIENILSDSDEENHLNDIIGNVMLSERFLSIVSDMDLVDVKSLDDIYKNSTKKSDRLLSEQQVDSARANLASTFVNSFVHAGYCKDKLLLENHNNSNITDWVYKNKDHGMLSATASLGLVMLWNVEEGLNAIDKYFHASNDYIKAGACLGVGILSSGIRNESDPALALLCEHIEGQSTLHMKIASICGLGIAYAGASREDILELYAPIIANSEDGVNFPTVCLAALSISLIYVGTCDDDVSTLILQRLMETSDVEFNQTNMSRLLCLSLGLIYLGKGEKIDMIMEALKTISHDMREYAEITLETCAYAGTGDVLQVQKMLRVCAEHLTSPEENKTNDNNNNNNNTPSNSNIVDTNTTNVFNDHQSVAVLGIALVALGEDVSTDMALRTFEHLLHYAEINVKRVVPLAIALLYVSNPDYSVVDQLSRLSHDSDAELSQNAIFGLGLISAGTNNSRVAGLLRQLSEFYMKEANHLYVVRIAQGLNAMGKGLLTINPFHSDRLLLQKPSLGGLLTVLHCCLDMKKTILDKYHYLLYFLTISINPRVCSTVIMNEDDSNVLDNCPVSVRVGQAVETVGQAGRPKTITGFQTHNTPVLLGYKDRAELAASEHKAICSVIEGVVIVKKVDPVTIDDNDKMES